MYVYEQGKVEISVRLYFPQAGDYEVMLALNMQVPTKFLPAASNCPVGGWGACYEGDFRYMQKGNLA